MIMYLSNNKTFILSNMQRYFIIKNNCSLNFLNYIFELPQKFVFLFYKIQNESRSYS